MYVPHVYKQLYENFIYIYIFDQCKLYIKIF
jgi:hypothetical protein